MSRVQHNTTISERVKTGLHRWANENGLSIADATRLALGRLSGTEPNLAGDYDPDSLDAPSREDDSSADDSAGTVDRSEEPEGGVPASSPSRVAEGAGRKGNREARGASETGNAGDEGSKLTKWLGL